MKKIMFNDRYGLTQAVLDGKKTMTRRIINTPADMTQDFLDPIMGIDDKGKVYFTVDYCDGSRRDIYPQYQIGEEVAIAQNYKRAGWEPTVLQYQEKRKNGKVVWRGDMEFQLTAGWTNKMFVLPDLMPYRIRITDIKVEKLQDISIEDCEKEGIIHINWRQYLKQDIDDFSPQPYKDHNIWTLPIFEESFIDSWAEQKEGEFAATSADIAFAVLIERISGKGTWMSNPWVFAYTFELQKEGGWQ